MKIISLLSSWSLLCKSDKIQHLNVPSCKNCIYFRPSLIRLDNDSVYTFGKCQKFGRKDIVSDKINYKFADVCRADEFKCGFRGKYFIQEKYAQIREIVYKMIILSYYVIAMTIIYFYWYTIIIVLFIVLTIGIC